MDELPQQPKNNFYTPTDISSLAVTEELSLITTELVEETTAEIKKRSFWQIIKKFQKDLFYLGPSFFLSLILAVLLLTSQPVKKLAEPIFPKNTNNLTPLTQTKPGYEVFGFAPYWNFDKLNNIDFATLTTLAYFGVDVLPDGNLNRDGKGYQAFISPQATELFKKAHANGTRVVLTITQMDNSSIKAILDDPRSQDAVVAQTVQAVKDRGIDGVNIDFEYTGDPGAEYRTKFSNFASKLTQQVHSEIPSSKVTASVYASAIKDPKIYDIATLSSATDEIFMMAYDFAVAGSSNAIPTSPLYGYKEGKYWYDVSTAVDAFLSQMPSDKLVLGVPWYGYNYAVNAPQVKTATTKGYYTYYKKGRRTYRQFVPLNSHAQSYALAENITPQNSDSYREGFDEYGQVSWKAYMENGVWRMVFIDDVKSQAVKYDFAKQKKLAGVGMWALGFEDGNPEVWDLLREKFGVKNMADSSIVEREIQ